MNTGIADAENLAHRSSWCTLGSAVPAPRCVTARGVERAALTVGFALVGMGGGRIISRLVDEKARFYPIWFYCLVEFIAAALVLGVA